MNAREVHALLAAGVQDPQRIAAWQREPGRLQPLGVTPGSIDLTALAKFAGLTVKVRHNALRDELPMSFRLMGVAGLEIEVFAAYAAHRAAAGLAYAADTAGRMHDLIEFLEGWLDRRVAAKVMLWDLVRHEAALSRLARLTSAPAPLWPPATQPPCAASVPTRRGELVLHEMQCDPRLVSAALRASHPQFDHIELGERYFAHWRPDEGGALRVIELDAFGHWALSLVDGRRSLADLSQAMGSSRRPSRRFMQLIGQLVDAGMLRADTPVPAR